jgi:hypothetical protein
MICLHPLSCQHRASGGARCYVRLREQIASKSGKTKRAETQNHVDAAAIRAVIAAAAISLVSSASCICSAVSDEAPNRCARCPASWCHGRSKSRSAEQIPHIRHLPSATPPRLVIIPRAFNSAAIARRLVAPVALMSATTCARSCAWTSALALTAARNATAPFPARRRAAARSGCRAGHRAHEPRRGPFVRREMSSRSACATRAMMPTVRSLASATSRPRAACATATPRSVTSLTASILNSRLNFRHSPVPWS